MLSRFGLINTRKATKANSAAGNSASRCIPRSQRALRLGGDKLAVDAVLLIAEHGDYLSNEKGQKLYPRYEWFEEIVKVFEQDGQAVPVYNDKHLSYDFAKARKMVEDSKRLEFPMLAGSSIPVTWRLPELELPLDCEIEEVVMAGAGGSDAHDFHALEGLQAMVERRKGGESGVKAVQLLQGEEVWKAGEDGRWSKQILEAALSCSDELQGITLIDARPQDLLGSGVLPQIVKEPRAYLIDRNDGLRTTLLWLNGAVGDFLFAGQVEGANGNRLDAVPAQPWPQRSLLGLPGVAHREDVLDGARARIRWREHCSSVACWTFVSSLWYVATNTSKRLNLTFAIAWGRNLITAGRDGLPC